MFASYALIIASADIFVLGTSATGLHRHRFCPQMGLKLGQYRGSIHYWLLVGNEGMEKDTGSIISVGTV